MPSVRLWTKDWSEYPKSDCFWGMTGVNGREMLVLVCFKFNKAREAGLRRHVKSTFSVKILFSGSFFKAETFHNVWLLWFPRRCKMSAELSWSGSNTPFFFIYAFPAYLLLYEAYQPLLDFLKRADIVLLPEAVSLQNDETGSSCRAHKVL